MAKMKSYDGVAYYPAKMHNEGTCQWCTSKLHLGQVAYHVGHKDSEVYVCQKCLGQKLADQQRKLQKEIFEFPVSAILYIGKTSGHKCHLPEPAYEPCMATFRVNRLSVNLQVHRCPACGEYILKTKTYEKHRHMFKEYKLISIKTGKEIIHLSSVNKSAVPVPKQYREIPTTVQQAVLRPYQGGRCSGK